jgi:hypothetical protein
MRDLRHFASTRFWQCFDVLPVHIQRLARRNFALLKNSPTHPSLHFKTIHDGQYYSVRVGLHYRALGVAVPEGVQWFWIGTHAEYDLLVH